MARSASKDDTPEPVGTRTLRQRRTATVVTTIPDSDDSSSDLSDPPSPDPLELSDGSDSSDDRAGKKRQRLKRGNKNRTSNPENVRRSTRDTRNRTKYDFSTGLEDDEGDLVEDKVETDPSTKKRRGRPSRRAVESSDEGSEEDDLLELSRENASSRRSRQVTSAHANTNTSDKACDEHQPTCSRCSEKYEPNLVQIWTRTNKNRRGKARAGSLLDRYQSLEDVYRQGCWLECSTCTSSYHFGCLPVDMKKDITSQHRKERLELIRQRDAQDPNMDDKSIEIPPDKREQQPEIKLSLKCPACVKPYGCQCMICGKHNSTTEVVQDEVKTTPTAEAQQKDGGEASTVNGKSQGSPEEVTTSKLSKEPIIFRCTSCKRAAHYSCLPAVGDEYPTELEDIAEYWQTDWTCAECDELAEISVEIILAWRKPVPKALDPIKDSQSATQELTGSLHDQPKGRSKDSKPRSALPNPKDPFEQAEYLCKYEDFSFTDCSWVTHSYLVAKHPAKLRNFLTKGPALDLKQFSGGDFDDSGDSDSDANSDDDGGLPFNLDPDQDAQLKIPKAWLTPEKILSIEFEDELLIEDAKEADIPDTPEEMYETMDRAYIKWEEQTYADATWSDKTPKDSPYFPAFMSALKRFMQFRKFVVPTVKSSTELAKLDTPRRESSFSALEKQPDFIPHQLMGFQLEGVNFCYYNWHRQHPTILADEMGLGKTVQICSLIAVLKNKERRMPFLIVVPNSTLGNWSRECAKWIPDVKCVPLPGDSDSCEVVQNWELFKTSGKSKRQLAASVVLATYQSAEKHANLLREVQRWEVVIVDEGQRLKSGAKGGLFRALSSLRVGHRILMSGTPLNNNLGELFNLLAFLNPDEYPPDVVEEMELRYSALTPELIDELRTIIRPYMLRRTKETVLDLPPLTEIIVPITMRPLQKQVYRGLLSKNANLITSIYSKGSKQKKSTRAGFQNLLMQLRKTLGHPYLYDPEIEPSNVPEAQVQENLVEASAKLIFLRKFIPKLLARGHRMLIFSQFTMFLDVMERFLDGENMDYLRLDGNTSQLDRQTRIDHFNRKNSNYNIFLLSTRAGGAGINLATADVVIVLDPDWNPHNDLQAISRAHRFGQKKPVSVFKLMVKGSAEEKIVQTGKRKLVLDHLVIQKASEEEIEANDVASILQYGAQELLTASDEALQKDVRYTDEELDDLIQRTAEGAKSKESADGQSAKPDKSFAFARVWEGGDKGLTSLEEIEEDKDASNAQDQRSFWDSILQANEAERAKENQEESGTGRGHRRRKDVDYNMPQIDLMLDSPQKKGGHDDDMSSQGDDNYEPISLKEVNSESSDSEGEPEALPDLLELIAPPPTKEQLEKNRRDEERIKADRRKEQWDKKLAGLLSQPSLPPVASGSGSSQAASGQGRVVYDPATGTYLKNESMKKSSQEAHNRPAKVSQVGLISLSELEGLNNEERRSTMDSLWFWLTSKAKALQNPALDKLLSSARNVGQVEQVARLNEARQLVKQLVHNRQNLAERRGSQVVPSLPAATSSSQIQPHPHPPANSHRSSSTSQYRPAVYRQAPGAMIHHHHQQPPPPAAQSSSYYQSSPAEIQARYGTTHHHNGSLVGHPNQAGLNSLPSGSGSGSGGSRIPNPALSHLPPPKFSQTNPQSIKPLLTQQNASLYPSFNRPSSSLKRNHKGEFIN
ncbi:uncharacterized protein PGTG_05896 [Puccinia graminis f. sp. tritici CRL 75-36-700-3]|uniref:Uncharacterized protein n=1 Tax=Puccinia graminis f. sp. tritici (strain CRL 75-36-700-3 / race SCCL) TaxID=418459 RepID=E3K604_PUCGT|nr:uncharacterized protein PGTG_05896 [Puccinia graminis f. sp. tritici CRL 75-36-700-3]EFP79575.2 hypothetical protein PGTG_05896 [Puccinia graminis f. sp. tritici CRL 75-36-700-3]